MKINGHTIEFSGIHPQADGYYLWRPPLSGGVEVIRVVYYPSKTAWGIDWDSYYGIPSHGGRDVRKLLGCFAKIEEV